MNLVSATSVPLASNVKWKWNKANLVKLLTDLFAVKKRSLECVPNFLVITSTLLVLTSATKTRIARVTKNAAIMAALDLAYPVSKIWKLWILMIWIRLVLIQMQRKFALTGNFCFKMLCCVILSFLQVDHIGFSIFKIHLCF